MAKQDSIRPLGYEAGLARLNDDRLVVAVIIVVTLGQLPGRIAQQRAHPQAAAIEEAIPGDDLRMLCEQTPEFNEVAVAGPLVFERGLDELIEFAVALASALKIDVEFLRGALMKFAEASHARRSDALGMACAESIEERPVAFVEEENAVNIIAFAEVSGEAGPEGQGAPAGRR